jgi:hypothetical protein
VGVDDLLHLLLDLLGENTAAELLEQARVLGLQELGAARERQKSHYFCTRQLFAYNDRSQALIFSTGTLSSIPLTPA